MKNLAVKIETLDLTWNGRAVGIEEGFGFKSPNKVLPDLTTYSTRRAIDSEGATSFLRIRSKLFLRCCSKEDRVYYPSLVPEQELVLMVHSGFFLSL